MKEFPRPNFNIKMPLLAPPSTNHYQLVGTAFDYLLRFIIKHINPNTIESSWIVEASLKLIGTKLTELKE